MSFFFHFCKLYVFFLLGCLFLHSLGSVRRVSKNINALKCLKGRCIIAAANRTVS